MAIYIYRERGSVTGIEGHVITVEGKCALKRDTLQCRVCEVFLEPFLSLTVPGHHFINFNQQAWEPASEIGIKSFWHWP